ncbi:MAG: acyl-CoA thioesterase [Haloglomus sp.]
MDPDEIPDDPAADRFHYVWENQVRYAETDAQSVVFYGEYVTYQDETFTEFLRTVDYPYHELEASGIDFHVVHTELDYHSFAQFDDELRNGFRVAAIRDSSADFEWICRQATDDRIVASGELTHVAVDEDGPTRVSDEFRDAVVAFQDEPPEPV